MIVNSSVHNYRSRLQERLDRNPQDVDALVHLGALLFEYFHESEQALSLLQKAVELDPLNVNAKFWLAMSLSFDYFEYTKAEKILQEVLKLDGHHAASLGLIAWIIRDNNGPLDQAIEYAQKALIYAPDWPMLWCQLAELLLTTGDVKGAEEEIQKIFKIPPMDLEKITNEVEYYYENVVTGRGWSEEKKRSLYILQRIEQAKLEREQKS
jgi:tetratricopeptide (TPR) repeat protein